MSPLRLSLGIAVTASASMLVRAIVVLSAGAYLYVRPWCTVVASLALLVGGIGALRGRTWGVLLCAAAGMSFFGAWVVGIAPTYFIAMGAVGVLPMVLIAPLMFGFDRRAAVAAVSIAFALGASAAVSAGPVLDTMLAP